MFETVKAVVEEVRGSAIKGIYRDIFYEKKEEAYGEWRDMVDELLETTKAYATTEEDRKRFVDGKPIVKDYEMAKTVIGDLRGKHDTLTFKSDHLFPQLMTVDE